VKESTLYVLASFGLCW